MKRVLVCEDEDSIREFVVINLVRSGYEVVDVNCGEDALKAYDEKDGGFDVALLDIMMPGMDGMQVCKKIREKSETIGIIMLSAKSQEMDKISCLMSGADDYITKPFLPEELVLRVGAILKRSYFRQGNREEGQLCLSGRKISFENATVEYQGQTTTLTAKELLLLKKLAANRGNIVTFDALCQAVWNDNYYGYENSLMVHIRHLREKIENDPSHPEWILTARGIGYRLAKESVS